MATRVKVISAAFYVVRGIEDYKLIVIKCFTGVKRAGRCFMRKSSTNSASYVIG